MEIRVVKEPTGVLPELMPEVGAVYRATGSVRRPGVQQFAEFCWIELHGKKIVLRKGEYEIVAEDPPEEETMHKKQEQEKTPVQEALPAAEPPKKGGRSRRRRRASCPRTRGSPCCGRSWRRCWTR